MREGKQRVNEGKPAPVAVEITSPACRRLKGARTGDSRFRGLRIARIQKARRGHQSGHENREEMAV